MSWSGVIWVAIYIGLNLSAHPKSEIAWAILRGAALLAAVGAMCVHE